MRSKIIMAVLLTILLTGCASSSQQTVGDSKINLSKGEPSDHEEMEEDTLEAGNSVQPGAQTFDIRFAYRNDFYGYDLEATWSDVSIVETNTNLNAEIYGLELLFDGHSQLFDELDIDSSGSLDLSEWADIESDFPLTDYDIDEDGGIDAIEFTGFSQKLGGIDAYPTGFTITQPTLENHALELNGEEGPVSIKILRASTAGFTGGYGYYFPAGTVFVELAADYRIYMPEAGDMDVTSAFDYPLLNMYVDDKKEVKDSYSHGAIGFSSVIDTDAFNGIFSGNQFSLQYEAYYKGKVVGTYDLTITPT